jgi:choline-sulfatase
LQTIKDDDENRSVFAEYHGHGVHSSAYMIRKGDWKLIYNVDAKHQLYNLKEDPEELNNLFEDRTDIYNQLKKELLNICVPEKECKKAEKFIQKQLQQI